MVSVEKRNRSEVECWVEKRCLTCHENHLMFSKTCSLYKKKIEIMQVKYQRNISFPEARKFVESYMGTSVTQKTNWIRQTESKQENK